MNQLKAVFDQRVSDIKTLQEVCIIDDSSIPRLITLRICENYFNNVPVKVFEDVDSSLAYLSRNKNVNRVIFLDLHMPHRDGWSFLESYNCQEEESIFILSSSSIDEDKEKSKYYNTVKEFITKPITFDILNSLFPRV